MDRSEIDNLVERLVADPHDEEALAYAHREGEADPKAYAQLLERVGSDTRDPLYASHWLSEAANVWSTTLNDMHRAARLLMMAVDKDPTQQTAAERLATLYREKGDTKALVALLDRRAKALAPLLTQQPELRDELAGIHEEMGRLWSEPPLAQPKKAIEHFRRAVELDPRSAYAIYNARELLKQQGQYTEALPLYQAELEIEQDPARRAGLLRDEAATRKLSGDLQGATIALAAAREIDPEDPALQQEYAASIVDRVQAGERVREEDRAYAVELLVNLAEAFPGEHALAYTAAALDIEPGHDRAMQLFAHYAQAGDSQEALVARFRAYLEINPSGTMAPDARGAVAASARDGGILAQDGPAERAPARPRPDLAAQSAPAMEPALPSTDAVAARPAAKPGRGDGRPAAAARAAAEDLEDLLVEAPRRSGPLSADKLQGVLDAAQMLVGKGKKPEALAKYKEVLEHDPAHPEALAWVEDYLRAKRDYTQLRDVLLSSIRAAAIDRESRKERLREVAGLCEGNLRDVDGAIAAWRQLLAIDRTDEAARSALMRLLERSQRWDDLATLLEQEANIESDVETKIVLEKKLARLQEDRRKDLVAAGDAWSRIVQLTPDDEFAIQTAARLFEKAERLDLAARTIAEAAPFLEDPIAKGNLLQRLAEFREQLGETAEAGDSFAEAAEALRSGKLWEDAERLYSEVEAWEKAANAAYQRGLLTGDIKQQAQCHARSADYLMKVGDVETAIERLEEANNLDPLNDDYAASIVKHYTTDDQIDKLVSFLSRRGDRMNDRVKRVNLRRQAASLCSARMMDPELARELWLKVLDDGDDKEALERLIDDAIERLDHTEGATLLRRLGTNTVDKAEKAKVALREAELLAEGVGDIDTAISRYEVILSDLDPTCRPALQAIANLQENRSELGQAADALERELKLVADVQERGQLAGRLARLYEQLDDPRSAIRAFDLVRKADPEDFDALTRLCELCELTEQWGRVAELLVERIEVEADEEEVSRLTMRLAQILADKLDRGDEALGALTDLADQGDSGVRDAYIELGDRLGWKGIVATKLKEWWLDARQSSERTSALRGAFERFADVGRDQDAVSVAIELLRNKGAENDLARRLEELAVKTGDLDALTIAHDLLAREVSGTDRARELVRQAEVRVQAGMGRADAIQHGEAGLPGVAPSDVEPLLERLATLAAKPGEVVDLYERQVSRSKAPQDRIRALARAAQVATARAQPDRARGFFELALAGAPSEETLTLLEATAREGDRNTGGDRLRRALCQALASGGHGARDGGRTRGSLLRRAAQIAHQDLSDIDQAFAWLADALVSHVDAQTLDALEGLALEIGDPRRAEGGLSHALSEVFDGPLVRQLLARRARIRREFLDEPGQAAADLKKLHDLSPNDQAVLDELAGLLAELSDFRGLVQLYEDQILRGKDMNARAELARKVARMWEEQLQDAREAADAWRRVLRMKAGDEEATQGLARAKSNLLKKADPATIKEAYAPPRLPSTPTTEARRPDARSPQESKKPDTLKSGPSGGPPKVPSARQEPKAEPKPEAQPVLKADASPELGALARSEARVSPPTITRPESRGVPPLTKSEPRFPAVGRPPITKSEPKLAAVSALGKSEPKPAVAEADKADDSPNEPPNESLSSSEPGPPDAAKPSAPKPPERSRPAPRPLSPFSPRPGDSPKAPPGLGGPPKALSSAAVPPLDDDDIALAKLDAPSPKKSAISERPGPSEADAQDMTSVVSPFMVPSPGALGFGSVTPLPRAAAFGSLDSETADDLVAPPAGSANSGDARAQALARLRPASATPKTARDAPLNAEPPDFADEITRDGQDDIVPPSKPRGGPPVLPAPETAPAPAPEVRASALDDLDALLTGRGPKSDELAEVDLLDVDEAELMTSIGQAPSPDDDDDVIIADDFDDVEMLDDDHDKKPDLRPRR